MNVVGFNMIATVISIKYIVRRHYLKCYLLHMNSHTRYFWFILLDFLYDFKVLLNSIKLSIFGNTFQSHLIIDALIETGFVQ